MKKYELFMRESADWNDEYTTIIEDEADTYNFAVKRLMLDQRDREVTAVLALNVKNEVIGVHEVSIGSIDETILNPREIFKFLILSNANCGVLMHNHPSGHTMPSMTDIYKTKQIVDCGKIMGIPIIDHVIVGNGYGYSSMNTLGFFDDWKGEEKWEQVAE